MVLDYNMMLQNTKTGEVYDVCESAIIGRSDTCDIIIREPTLSRTHAEIKNVSGDWYITDLNSSNGVYVDGVRIPAGKMMPIGSGSQIILADSVPLLVQYSSEWDDDRTVRAVPPQNSNTPTTFQHTTTHSSGGGTSKYSSLKEYIEAPENKKIADEIRTDAIFLYVSAGVTLAYALISGGYGILLDVLLVIIPSIIMHINKSKIAAYIVAVIVTVEMIVTSAMNGSFSGWLPFLAGCWAAYSFYKADKSFKESQGRSI